MTVKAEYVDGVLVRVEVPDEKTIPPNIVFADNTKSKIVLPPPPAPIVTEE